MTHTDKCRERITQRALDDGYQDQKAETALNNPLDRQSVSLTLDIADADGGGSDTETSQRLEDREMDTSKNETSKRKYIRTIPRHERHINEPGRINVYRDW